MGKRIYKYILEVIDYQEIQMPVGAQILTIQTQPKEILRWGDTDSMPCLWAIIDEQAEIETVSFRTIGTGHFIYEESEIENYIGTYQLNQGLLVFHVFKI